MEALLAEGVNGLVIAPFNSLYIAAEIDRLTEMNIPVITVNTDILSRRIAYVGSNYRLSGQTAAGLVSLMTFGEIHIGIVTGSSHVSVTPIVSRVSLQRFPKRANVFISWKQ